MAHAVGGFGHDSLVYADSCVVIHVAGFCQTDDGVDENVGLALASGADGQFTVCAVHRITSLKGDDLAPREFFEM